MVSELNTIGLKRTAAKTIANKLNELLANYQGFYFNTRGFHWNIKGNKFFELHLKFEELYNDALKKIDEIAERILTLECTPIHTLSDFWKDATIEEVKNVKDGDIAIRNILKAYEIILPMQRQTLALANKNNDEGTSTLMSDYIREQEKLVWMYSSYLK